MTCEQKHVGTEMRLYGEVLGKERGASFLVPRVGGEQEGWAGGGLGRGLEGGRFATGGNIGGECGYGAWGGCRIQLVCAGVSLTRSGMFGKKRAARALINQRIPAVSQYGGGAGTRTWGSRKSVASRQSSYVAATTSSAAPELLFSLRDTFPPFPPRALVASCKDGD
ncbi:hypothetical protein FGB62_69g116 [Gracilaria domingensis]|nr:hypothetical protein FGB62_69g116 [Gracilaria domingensis]